MSNMKQHRREWTKSGHETQASWPITINCPSPSHLPSTNPAFWLECSSLLTGVMC